MFDRLKNKFKFNIEHFLLRGAYARLLFIASLIGLVASAGGLLVQVTDGSFVEKKSAIWWAFLRLTDPGYLGDDEGLPRRVISTVLTVLGYVLFMGSLIAILTQWLNQKIRDFERGLTPIVRRNHILILGWTNRTPAVVEELMRSGERVHRFLKLRGARGLHVVILSEEVSLERTIELRNILGPLWDARRITFRSGTALRMEHLERVDYQNASAIILPGADFAYGGANESDMRIVKTLLTIANQFHSDSDKTLPLLVTELFDFNKTAMLQKSYQGILEILATDVFITRCMAQTVRHPGLSLLIQQILTHRRGNSIHIRTIKSVTGNCCGDLAGACPRAILLGVVRFEEDKFRPLLSPPKGLVVQPDDRLVFLARRYEDCIIHESFYSKPPPSPSQIKTQPVNREMATGARRILILGWNYKVAALIKELDDYLHENFEVSTLSIKPIPDREAELKQRGIDQQRMKVSHFEGDYTLLSDLEAIEPDTYDNVIVFGGDWLETQEESDARTIVGHMVLKNIIEKSTKKPTILVDLMDADNARLFQDINTEVLVTPMMASHVLAQVSLRRELNSVYTELFGVSGAEIFFRCVSDYGIVDEEMTFATLMGIMTDDRETALGVRLMRGDVKLNPEKNTVFKMAELDSLIVLG